MHKIMRMPLKLTPTARNDVWQLGRRQDQSYNAGVELGLSTDERVPSRFDGYKHLTRLRNSGVLPRHSVVLQRGGLGQGLEAVRKHRTARWKLAQSVDYWKAHDPARHARAADRLERFDARCTGRLFRRRKTIEQTARPSVVFNEGARIDNDHLVVPGGVRLRAAAPIVMPDGWEFTGAVQIKDRTRKVTARTGPQHRRYEALLSLKAPDPAPTEAASIQEILGVDVGVAISVCRSDGGEHRLPDERAVTAQIKHTQRKRSRCDRGSRRWQRHAHRAKTLNRRRANIRKDASCQTAAQVARSGHKEVAVENLNVRNMTASARGTTAHPGTNVAPKRGLNRSLSRAAFARLLSDIERACLIAAVAFTAVPPQGTSQTCHRCTAQGARETQALFECPRCGWSGNADHNAALNMRRLAWERRQGLSPKDGQDAGNASTRRKAQTRPSQTNVEPVSDGHHPI